MYRIKEELLGSGLICEHGDETYYIREGRIGGYVVELRGRVVYRIDKSVADGKMIVVDRYGRVVLRLPW
ncbi:MAG: hypothetical protein Q4A79_01940 [Candidatus Saccharibacteria bacterium]|nr:hypothetical protein [Candidatus Saccharibacteria bacterium]